MSTGRGVRVPMREIALSNGETLRVYDTSGPQGHDVREGLPKLRERWVAARRGGGGVTQLHFARKGVVTRKWSSSRSAKGSIRSSSARRSRAGAPSFRRTSTIRSSSR